MNIPSDTVIMLFIAAISSMFSGLMLYIIPELLTKKHFKKGLIMKEKLTKLESLLEDILEEMDDADKDIDTNEFYADLLNLYNSLNHYQYN